MHEQQLADPELLDPLPLEEALVPLEAALSAARGGKIEREQGHGTAISVDDLDTDFGGQLYAARPPEERSDEPSAEDWEAKYERERQLR